MPIDGKHIGENPKGNGKAEMTIAQFKIWVKQSIDSDRDGKINKQELAEAVRANGGWFANFKGKRGVRSADANRNGFVDENEFDELLHFAQKHLGIKIIDI